MSTNLWKWEKNWEHRTHSYACVVVLLPRLLFSHDKWNRERVKKITCSSATILFEVDESLTNKTLCDVLLDVLLCNRCCCCDVSISMREYYIMMVILKQVGFFLDLSFIPFSSVCLSLSSLWCTLSSNFLFINNLRFCFFFFLVR